MVLGSIYEVFVEGLHEHVVVVVAQPDVSVQGGADGGGWKVPAQAQVVEPQLRQRQAQHVSGGL